FFNAVAYTPPQLMFSSTSGKPDRARGKDSVANIEETGVFCVNIVDYALRDAMNVTSGAYGREVDEFALAGLERAECETIACSRVAAAPAALECKLIEIIPLRGETNLMVLGEVTGIHMRDDCLVDGRFDVTRYQPLTRLGYKDYGVIRDVFEMNRPGQE
ncbi:flavin reductase family protein, partial [Thioclava sp. BHET1]